MNLYDVNSKETISMLVNEVTEQHPDLTKTQAKILVLNAIWSNLVVEEITNQVNFLIENNGYSMEE